MAIRGVLQLKVERFFESHYSKRPNPRMVIEEGPARFFAAVPLDNLLDSITIAAGRVLD